MSLTERKLAGKFFDSTVEPRSCLHHLLPPPCNSVLLSCLRAASKFPLIPKDPILTEPKSINPS